MKQVGDSTRRRASFDRDWTKGSIIRNLLSLSWPMITTNSLMMMGPTIDMVWVGKLGAASVAGVGISGMAVQLITGAMMGLAMGMRAIIARFIGAGDTRGANHIARQGFAISTTFSIITATIGICLARPILIWMGVEPDVVAEGAAYMRILFVGSIVMSCRMITEGIMQASGDALSPMKITIGYRLFHIALCPFLVFGWGIFPSLGVSGAAMTNVISQSIGTGIGFWFLFSGRTRIKINMRNFRLDISIIWRIIKIGFPALVSGIQRTSSQFLLMYLIVPFGTMAVAAHTINQRVEMVIMMPAMAFGMASGVLAGQNLGAGQPERAEKSAWLAVVLVESIAIICSVVILFASENIVSIFSSEPAVVEIGSSFLKIAIVGFIMMGFMASTMQALSGVGDTIPPMVTSLATMWLITLPLAYFLPKVTTLGVYGVRWAMVAGMVVPAIVLTTYFKTGRWKRKQV